VGDQALYKKDRQGRAGVGVMAEISVIFPMTGDPVSKAWSLRSESLARIIMKQKKVQQYIKVVAEDLAGDVSGPEQL